MLNINGILSLNIFQLITEPANLHWLDVKESYFNSYRQNLEDVFKAPGGRIIQYEEMKPEQLYKKRERVIESTSTKKRGSFFLRVMMI